MTSGSKIRWWNAVLPRS